MTRSCYWSRAMKLTDEEYVATGWAMPDAEYLDLMRRRYGFDW